MPAHTRFAVDPRKNSSINPQLFEKVTHKQARTLGTFEINRMRKRMIFTGAQNEVLAMMARGEPVSRTLLEKTMLYRMTPRQANSWLTKMGMALDKNGRLRRIRIRGNIMLRGMKEKSTT